MRTLSPNIRQLWSNGGKRAVLMLATLVATIPALGQNKSTPEIALPGGVREPGAILSGRALSIPEFNLLPGGVLEWPGRLRLAYGGGESAALPKTRGLTRAQPGGNLILQPMGDYKRTGFDLLPTEGKIPEMDAIAEFTLHRIPPTANDQEMVSFSALGQSQNQYGIIVEAHGKGQLKPFSFLVVRGGLPANPRQEPFSAEAMQVTPEGTVEFGRIRNGGPLKRPVNSITL